MNFLSTLVSRVIQRAYQKTGKQVVVLVDAVYVFEFKYDGTPEEALAQIDSKQYALPFQADGRKVLKIGVNFDSSTLSIGDWKIVEG